MLIGQFLAAAGPGEPYHSPWFPSGGNQLVSVIDVMAVVGGATIDVEVQTKNSEQDDNNATILGASGPVGLGRTPFTVGANIDQGSMAQGFFELTRYKYVVNGAAGEGVHFRMQNPSWLGH